NAQLAKDNLVGCAGKEISISLNEFGPGSSGPHYHQGDSFTYVLEGAETYQLEGKPEVVVKAGDLLHEEPLKIHTVANSCPVGSIAKLVMRSGRVEVHANHPDPSVQRTPFSGRGDSAMRPLVPTLSPRLRARR